MADEGFSDEENQANAVATPTPPHTQQDGVNRIQGGFEIEELPDLARDTIMAEDYASVEDMIVGQNISAEEFYQNAGMNEEEQEIQGFEEPPMDGPHLNVLPIEPFKPPEELQFTVENVSLDLDTHVGSHTGIIKILRLQHVARHCPQLKVDALKMILKCLLESSDSALYTATYNELKNALQSGLNSEDGDASLPRFDETWVRDTKRNFDARLDRLEYDLKNYKTNSIKESIRRGNDEMGNHYLLAGDVNGALRSFNKARDYCEGYKDNAHNLANRLKACVYLRVFPYPTQLIEQMKEIETAMERNAAPTKEGKSKENGAGCSPSTGSSDRKLESSWNLIKACMGIYHLSVREYQKAADLFVSLNPEFCDFSSVIAGRDIALYGALCAVATYDRAKLKEKLINSKTFKSFLETAPEIRRLVEAFHKSQFCEFLKSFSSQKNVLLLDVFLAPHVELLFNQTRTHGMIEYFRCYASVSLAEMAEEFCWESVEHLQEELIRLILSNRLSARIDSVNKLLNKESQDIFLETAYKIQQDMDNLRKNMRFALIRTSMARNGHYVRMCRSDELGSSAY